MIEGLLWVHLFISCCFFCVGHVSGLSRLITNPMTTSRPSLRISRIAETRAGASRTCATKRKVTSDKVLLRSLETFREMYGHLRVKGTFVVPSEAPWPEDAWGLPLGSHVKDLRRQKCKNKVVRLREKLDEIGFIWTGASAAEENRREAFMVVFHALETYRSIYGHLQVPASYEVPTPSHENTSYIPDSPFNETFF